MAWNIVDMVRSRSEGRVIPGWQAGRLTPVRGVLEVRRTWQVSVHRHTVTASIRMLDQCLPPPPELWDAQVVEMTASRWIYVGWERLDDGIGGFRDYAQSWVMCEPREGNFHGCEAI